VTRLLGFPYGYVKVKMGPPQPQKLFPQELIFW